MDKDSITRLESRALVIAMFGNLVMCVAGVLTAILSNSTAIMMDGLFSLIGFAAAFVGRQVSRKIDAGPDRLRPIGYAPDEAIFLTFRALSLLGLILFAATSAAADIIRYLRGEPVPVLNFGPMGAYFLLIFLICMLLWVLHHRTWQHTGRTSDVLRLEAKASAFDAVLTAATGIGILAVYLFGEGWLAPIAPVGDSLIVLILCATIIGQYWRDLMAGLRELAGVTADPRIVLTARRALRPSIAEAGSELRDLAVIKLGRTYIAFAYVTPRQPISAHEIDRLNLRMIRDLRAELPGADVFLQISEHPRRWPDTVGTD